MARDRNSNGIEAKDPNKRPESSVGDIGQKVDFIASQKDRKAIDKKAVLRENFDLLEVEMEDLKAARKENGDDCLNDPVVFYAQVVENASDHSKKNGYAVRVGQLRMNGGQGHETAIKRIKSLGHLVIGHDLPTYEQLEEFKKKNGSLDIADAMKRFEVMLEFVQEEIANNFSNKIAADTIDENKALKAKIKEMQASIEKKPQEGA